jgi:hypothetical protein
MRTLIIPVFIISPSFVTIVVALADKLVPLNLPEASSVLSWEFVAAGSPYGRGRLRARRHRRMETSELSRKGTTAQKNERLSSRDGVG